MLTVEKFFDMISLNAYHNVRIKSIKNDETITFFNSFKNLREDLYDKEIKHFATDWENKIYIIWI